jgi:hypothetical protein
MSRKRKVTGTAVYGTVCTVVGEDGGREPSSYPIYTATAVASITGLALRYSNRFRPLM